jgi:DNA-binding YbaB/EbfC family protein
LARLEFRFAELWLGLLVGTKRVSPRTRRVIYPLRMGRMPKDMRSLMQQAQKMQEELQKTQSDLSDRTYEATAGGGVVKATVRGSGELLSVEFDPAVLDPEDPEMAGDLVVAAVNAALKMASDDAGTAMGGLADGLDLGGLLG